MLNPTTLNHRVQRSVLDRELRGGRHAPKVKGAPVFKWDEDRRREKRERLRRLLKGMR